MLKNMFYNEHTNSKTQYRKEVKCMSDKEKELIEETKKEYEQYENMSPIEKAMYIGMYMKDKINNLKSTS